LFELQNSEIDDEHPEWIRNWVFGVTMLRTTGHVLAKIDGSTTSKHRAVVDERWNDWRLRPSHHWVFHEFIEKERNSILKAFKLGVELDEEGIWHQDLEADGIRLFREATYWWRDELEAIEASLCA